MLLQRLKKVKEGEESGKVGVENKKEGEEPHTFRNELTIKVGSDAPATTTTIHGGTDQNILER